MMNLKAVEETRKKNKQLNDYYCISCKIDMCSTVEAAAHLLGGCIVDSEPSGE